MREYSGKIRGAACSFFQLVGPKFNISKIQKDPKIQKCISDVRPFQVQNNGAPCQVRPSFARWRPEISLQGAFVLQARILLRNIWPPPCQTGSHAAWSSAVLFLERLYTERYRIFSHFFLTITKHNFDSSPRKKKISNTFFLCSSLTFKFKLRRKEGRVQKAFEYKGIH